MAGGGHGHHNITYGGLSLHATKGWHSRVGQGMCAVMWFWVLYRAKQDGAALMGWRHPWEGHGHGGPDDHGHEEVSFYYFHQLMDLRIELTFVSKDVISLFCARSFLIPVCESKSIYRYMQPRIVSVKSGMVC